MQPNNFDANLLRTLDVLLTERNVTRAAERLCISQPATSGALQRLREYFNDPLLIRMGRDMVLTPLAESLVIPVRDTLLQIQLTLSTRLTFDPQLEQRDFNIAMSDYGSFVLMPTLLRRLATQAPAVRCLLEPFNGASLSRVASGDLDLLVAAEGCEAGARPNASRELKMRRLHSEDFVCLVDENNSRVGDTLTLKQYQQLSHALVRFGPDLHTLVEQAWMRDGLHLQIGVVGPSFSSVMLMLPGTELIATAPRRLAEVLAPSQRLRILECPVAIQPLHQILMWHPRNDFEPAHQFLRKLFVEGAGQPVVRVERRPSQVNHSYL
jgi:DNA-binding transcriptional LysR family regulator